MESVFKYVKVQKFTVTVLDTYYDVDNTTLLSSEVRVSELIRAGSSYSYEALGTIPHPEQLHLLAVQNLKGLCHLYRNTHLLR